MSDLIKWSETNVGKYSMFDVELGGIKATVSCDNNNSENLISLLNELKHTHSAMNETNEKLKKEAKTSVLLSEAEKNTLLLMRKQIDGLLKSPTKESSVNNYIDSKGGIEQLKQLCKQGYKQKEIAAMWGLYPGRISKYIHDKGHAWKDFK